LNCFAGVYGKLFGMIPIAKEMAELASNSTESTFMGNPTRNKYGLESNARERRISQISN
jgi:hypothetical protein